jgi:thiosulfate/3-mercaptopyruvate sulfurtransferase
MVLKTARWTSVLLLFLALPGAGQSPLQWPVPPAGPPRKTVFPKILIGPAELSRLLKTGAVSLDAREPGPYAEGHLPGALSAREGLPGAGTVALYGEGDDCEEIARLYWLLRRAGRAEAEVRILDGGIAAWRSARLPLETGTSHPRPASGPSPSPGLQTTVDKDWVAESFGQEGVELLDVRDARGWERWETPPTFAAGHIPYALPFDPRALLPARGWPEPAEVRRRLATFGPRPGDPVRLESTFVLYAGDADDPRLGLGYLLLTLAGLDARVFPGGWKEWKAGASRPVVRVISAAELAGRLRRGGPGLSLDHPRRDLILIDLREASDFAIGHLPGALSLPFIHFPADFEKTVAAGWHGADPALTPLVLYCYGIDCVRSRKAGALAAHKGFRDLLWFRGGVAEWRNAGYPLFDSPLPTRSSPAGSSHGRGGARP